MQLTPPKQSTFYIALILAVLAILTTLGILFNAAPASTGAWLGIAAYAVLAAGNYLKGF